MRVLVGGVLSALCLAPLGATSVATAATPAQLCPDGQIAVIRFSTLKSPASRPGFNKATRDHMGWYRSHGLDTDRQLVGEVIDFDPATKTASVSPTEVVTIHLDDSGPEKTRAKRDAGWDAYVAEYNASSTVTTTKTLCLREPVK